MTFLIQLCEIIYVSSVLKLQLNAQLPPFGFVSVCRCFEMTSYKDSKRLIVGSRPFEM